MITVVIPSFYSSHQIKDRIKEIDNNIPIIIIENSLDIDLKKKIENTHKNVKIIIPKENLGFGKAVNIGIKESKTEFVFLTQPDVKLIDDCVRKLTECVKNFKDFSVLTPYDKNNDLFTNYEIYNSYNKSEKSPFMIEEVDYVDLTWLINKNNFEEEDLWDENIFLYFEAKDFAKRLKDRNKKIFISKFINTFHIGAASHDLRLDYYSKLNRNWHYNWSRFYFNKKHHGSIYAYKKGLSLLIKLKFKYIKSLIFSNKSERKLVFTELYGLLCSMLNLSSFYRPYKNAKFENK